MGTASEPISFAGGLLDKYRHVCAFFSSDEEEQRVLRPFITDGIARGERAFHIVDPKAREAYVARFEASGVPIRKLVATGQFELKNWEDAYLREGRFSQEAMLALIEEVLQEGPQRGYPLTRLVAHMEWALEDFPGVNDLVEYETRLNYVLPRYKDPVI